MVHHKPECKFPLRTSPVVHKIPKYPQNSCFVTTVSNCKIVGLHLSTFQHGLCQNQCIGIGNAVFKHQHNQFMQYFRTETVMQVLACRCCGESLHLHDQGNTARDSAAKCETTFSPSRILTDFSSSNVTHTISTPGSTVNLHFFVLTPAPNDDDALKLLDPLAATLQIGQGMDMRTNGDEN